MDSELDGRTLRLRNLCEEAVTRDAWKPRDGLTFCNLAAHWFAEHYGFHGLKGKLANDQFTTLSGSNEWEKIDTPEAIKQAKTGALVFAVKQYDEHGHIATCYTGAESYSGTWAKRIPMIANVGKNNGIMPCSQGFPVRDGEPYYFLLKSSRLNA